MCVKLRENILYLCGVNDGLYIESEFINGRVSVTDGPEYLDLSKATPLSSTGVSCNAYVSTIRKRRIFIKQLKYECIGKQQFRDAFLKEYELGRSLSHRCLPHYQDYYPDRYILTMDYVEGQTLAAMAASHDSWLYNPKNLRYIFSELVDVVDYLHRHNVVHCDIKADNVMITEDGHNVMLIDLGNAFAGWYNMLSGDSKLYNVDRDSKKKTTIDFHALAMLVDALGNAGLPVVGLGKFKAECLRDDVTTEDLRLALQPMKSKAPYYIGAATIGIALSLILWYIATLKTSVESISTKQSVSTRDTVVTVLQSPQPETSAQSESTPRVDYRAEIERGMAEQVKPLLDYITEITPMITAESTTDKQLQEFNMQASKLQMQVLKSASEEFGHKFPNVSATDIQIAVSTSKAFKDATEKCTRFTHDVTTEIMHRNPSLYSEEEIEAFNSQAAY